MMNLQLKLKISNDNIKNAKMNVLMWIYFIKKCLFKIKSKKLSKEWEKIAIFKLSKD